MAFLPVSWAPRPSTCNTHGNRPPFSAKRRPLFPQPPDTFLCIVPAPHEDIAAAQPACPAASRKVLQSAGARHPCGSMNTAGSGRWDTRLLYEERGQHRVSMDRAHQCAKRWRGRAETERLTHHVTRGELCAAQTEALLARESAGRMHVVAEEANGRVAVALLWVKRQRVSSHRAGSVRVSRNLNCSDESGRKGLFARDSQLLRALQRAESRIAWLEDRLWDEGGRQYSPLSSSICIARY